MGISIVLCIRLACMFLLLAWPHPVTAQEGFISIDCGSAIQTTDPSRPILFEADKYISTGESVTLSHLGTDYTFLELRTLRAFPKESTPTKNCYEVPVEPSRQYLIRASFYFGAYLPNPPGKINFQIALDASIWSNVSIDAKDNDDYYFEEGIYYTYKPKLSVCLIRTEDTSDPFISSLELRPLPYGSYLYRGNAVGSVWLVMQTRVNAGATQTTRYPDDPHDRLWLFTGNQSEVTNITGMESQQFYFDSTIDFAPFLVLRTAWTSPNSINFSFGPFDPLTDFALYVSVLVAEVQTKGAADRRIIDVTGNFLGNIAVDTAARSVYNLHNFQFNVPSDGNLTLNLQKDAISTLNPIINGFEIYSIRKVDPGTDDAEVNALDAVRTALGIERWAGDPCFPVPYVWDYIRCTNSHVTSIDLSNLGLSGLIPDFSALRSLTSLNLSHNKFNGSLPMWIGNLSSLKSLDVSNNELVGTFPASYIASIPNFIFSNNLNLQVGCDPSHDSTCSPPTTPQHTSKKFPIGVIIGVAGAIALLAAGVITGVVWYCCCHKPRKQAHAETVAPQSPLFHISPTEETNSLQARWSRGNAQLFTLDAVKVATNSFNTKIGEGGFGPVYFGTLPNLKQVAVKVMSGRTEQGFSEFRNEIHLLSKVHYAKLVSLVGYCQEGSDLILLYEFMSGGDLRQRLYGPKSRIPLKWTERLEIALDAAKGLEYLHQGCRPPIIHRDVKSSNILLTESLEAKVADFGLSKLTGVDQQNRNTTVVKGTPGYLDPEYHRTGIVSDKIDVYSFGVLLLEILCGQPPVVKKGSTSYASIVDKVRSAMNTGSLQAVADPGLGGQYKLETLWKLAELGMSCVSPDVASRPSMTKVVAELVQVGDIEFGGQVNTGWYDRSRSDFRTTTSNCNASGSNCNSSGSPSEIFHQVIRPGAR